MPKKSETKPVVKLAKSSYQPSKAELEEEVQIDASFQELTRAVVQDVKLKFVAKPKRKRNIKK